MVHTDAGSGDAEDWLLLPVGARLDVILDACEDGFCGALLVLRAGEHGLFARV